VLLNPSEPRQYRIVAAITMGRILTETAETLLIGSLKADDVALPEVLKSLGRIGGRGALAAIESLKLSDTHPAGGAARFATSLIAYRLDIAGHDLPRPDEKSLLRPERGDVRAIELRKMEPGQAKVVIEALARYPYGGVEFSPDAATHVHCAGETNIILVNREFVLRGTLIKATRRRSLFAIGALQSPETGDFSPAYLLFTHPRSEPGAVDMIVTRCSGAYAMAGVGRLIDDHGEYQLQSVRRPGARAMLVRGTLADGIVQAAEALSSTAREPPRVPRHTAVERA
jgi:hypothetical protein